jgi:hypothetical protein
VLKARATANSAQLALTTTEDMLNEQFDRQIPPDYRE